MSSLRSTPRPRCSLLRMPGLNQRRVLKVGPPQPSASRRRNLRLPSMSSWLARSRAKRSGPPSQPRSPFPQTRLAQPPPTPTPTPTPVVSARLPRRRSSASPTRPRAPGRRHWQSRQPVTKRANRPLPVPAQPARGARHPRNIQRRPRHEAGPQPRQPRFNAWSSKRRLRRPQRQARSPRPVRQV